MAEKGDKGICRLSVIPVRVQPTEISEMVTQLLFGDHYEVLDFAEDGKWIRISVFSDDYVGWIGGKQYYPISEEYFEQINLSDFKVCTDISGEILFKKHFIQIVLGSILPITANELFHSEEQFAYNGNSKRLGEKREYEYLKQAAKKYMNSPYLWGGKTPFGIDCSGLVQMAFKLSGYFLKRDSKQQALQGDNVESFDQSCPGDIAFFGDDANVSHVGIILENEEIIHSNGQVKIDILTDVGIVDRQSQQLTHKLLTIRRVLR